LRWRNTDALMLPGSKKPACVAVVTDYSEWKKPTTFRKETIMSNVAQILHGKKNQRVFRIAPEAAVLDAIKMMAAEGIGALLVMTGENIVGIVTERDYARKVVLLGRSSRDTPVHDIMSAPVMYAAPEFSTEECMALMTENRLRHLPVIDNDRLLGMISIGDLVKDIISEQRFIIEQLEHYIHGERV
jgi:CBS domain-containing protein